MAKSSIIQFLLSVFLLSTFCLQPIHAIKNSYVVYLGSHSHGPNPTAADLDSATTSHYNILGSLLGSLDRAQQAIIYSYNRNINGFAAQLEEEEAYKLAQNPNVMSVFLNRRRELHTTRSWEFLGLESSQGKLNNDSSWAKAKYGEDTIIANLDTGVWPESKSFSDEGMGPIPSKWRGQCQFGDLRSKKSLCNRKLIGGRFFIKGFEAFAGKQNASWYTTRDVEGHGSHTLSTAGGNFVEGANVLGVGTGTAKGGSPKARVAAYKVCWPPAQGQVAGGCFDADILAGFDAAISDGVDVISASIGGEPVDLFSDAIAIGSFHAISKGISVVSSAGNSGPRPGSVSNIAPWMLTVGASTLDRNFVNYIALGDRKHLTGATLSAMSLPSQKFYPLISSKDAGAPDVPSNFAELCLNGTLDPKKVKAKILVCLRGENARTAKGVEASRVGAVGMILANDAQSMDNTIADPHVLPASNINYEDGQYLYKYIKKAKNPVAYMTSAKTLMPIKPAPVMAAFSSRGPNTILPSILKPDITAPGVNIIAAYTEAIGPTEQDFDKRRVPFNAMSGTSMSCPHISGIVSLLKTRHPDWSPAAIRSAIMTTASTTDDAKNSILDSSMKEAIPFAYGAGHVQPDAAMDPGLVYDLTINDYLTFLCGYGYNETLIQALYGKPFTCPKSTNVLDFNYPSITVPILGTNTVKVTRTVTNVGRPSKYFVDIKVPKGLNVFVEPSHLRFGKVGEKKSFQVMIEGTGRHRPAAYSFAEIMWTNGKNTVRSPIVAHHK
ncbi:subtilisin-like protease SBT5.4 [Neltuma alba]|uniref:subtilisin-like protease SBT5.4 n=1 Tax=Neltuma alba TaxID=207710 RepID=UPI0010A48D1E|nr:subtilisin-like protease SBT5.4 [Prosopis alba]